MKLKYKDKLFFDLVFTKKKEKNIKKITNVFIRNLSLYGARMSLYISGNF